MILIACAGSIVILSVLVAVMLLPASAFTVKSDVPELVGVPVIVPLALSVRPAGSDPAVLVHVRELAPAALRV